MITPKIAASSLLALLALPAFAVMPGLNYSGNISTDGGQYTTGFSVGLKVSGNAAFVSSARHTEQVQINGHIAPQANQVGKTADLFVVARYNNQFFQRTSAGNFVPWNGNIPTLEPTRQQVVLAPDVEVPVFSGKLGLIGKIDIFVGYRLTESGALIYSSVPGSLNFVVGETPVACVVSAWGAWGPPSSGREKRTRTVVTPAAHGGAPCPALSETLPTVVLPQVIPLATPLPHPALPISSSVLDTAVLDFSHTANREWNYGGHSVPANFSTGQGNWDYNDASYTAFLFDRPTSWFKLYALTNNPLHKEYAIRDTIYYAANIDAEGYFTPKTKAGGKDTKYGYVTPFLWYERLTGDTHYRGVAERIYQTSLTGFANTYSPSISLWTEREAGLHGEAALAWYELTGEQSALDRAGAIIRQVGALADANGGAPQVPYSQHEGGGGSFLTNSPWMTALYFQFARRYYQITGDQQVLQQVSAYFDWLDVNGLYDGRLSGTDARFNGITVPRYLTGPLTGDANYAESDYQHCLDVAGIVAFAVEAKTKLALSTTKAEQRLAQLKTCAQLGFQYLTRTSQSLPKYRINPSRMWNWWMRGRYELQ